MSAHTPGPWQWDSGVIPPDGPGRYSDVYVDSGDKVIASINEFREFAPEEGRANARLISAAPDLLEALQNLMGLYDTPVERRRKANDPFYSEAVAGARSAIARATLQDGGGGMSRGKDIGCIPEASSNADAATPKSAAIEQVKPSARVFAAGDRVWIGISCHHYTVMSGPLPVVGKPGHFEHLVKPDDGEHQWTVEDRYLHRLPTNTPTPSDGAGHGTASGSDASQALRDEHQTATGEKG